MSVSDDLSVFFSAKSSSSSLSLRILSCISLSWKARRSRRCSLSCSSNFNFFCSDFRSDQSEKSSVNFSLLFQSSPTESIKSRWLRGLSSIWCSCWLATENRFSQTNSTSAAVAILSLIKYRLLPFLLRIRLSIKVPLTSKPFSCRAASSIFL